MNPDAPLGIFDSGVGGLSVLQEIRRLLPNEDVYYIADSAFAPYGNKPIELIIRRCQDLTRFLIEKDVKAVVVACNTATAAAVTTLREQFSVPVIGMEPGVKPAIAATITGTVGVLATENTLLSRQFTDLLHRFAADVEVISQPCPGLVEQIEAGEFNSPATQQLLRQYLTPLLDAGADTIVLGCTHYPLLVKQIADITGPTITLIETGRAVAQQLIRRLEENQLRCTSAVTGKVVYSTSGDLDMISRTISGIVKHTVSVEALPVHLLQMDPC